MKRQTILLSMVMLVAASCVLAQNDGVVCSRKALEYIGEPALWANGVYQLGKGTYLEFVTIKNNSRKPISLRGNASMRGNIIAKNDIEKNRLDIASHNSTMWLYILNALPEGTLKEDLPAEYEPVKFEPVKFDPKKPAKESYWVSGDLSSALLLGSVAGGIIYPIAYCAGVLLKKVDLLDGDRNLIRLALKSSVISGAFCALLLLIPSKVTVFNDIDSINAMNAAKKKEVDEINATRKATRKKEIDENNEVKRRLDEEVVPIADLFDACDSNTSWLEVPTMTLAPNKSVTFALLVFGKHQITVFDGKSNKLIGHFEFGIG